LRPLRGLTRGYHLSPFQGWEFETDVFYKAKPFRIFKTHCPPTFSRAIGLHPHFFENITVSFSSPANMAGDE
jgi:hypothetical protein